MSGLRYSAILMLAVAMLLAPVTAQAQLIPARLPAPEVRQQDAPSGQPARPARSLTRKVLGAAVGAFGGFFGGGYLGAALEPNCHCDDPGLKGALIGAPIGATAGGILGWHFLF